MAMNNLFIKMDISDNVLIIIDIIIVLIVLYLQFHSFNGTRHKITELKKNFPNISLLEIIESSVTKDILSNKDKLNKFLKNPPVKHESIPVAQTSDEEDDTSIKNGVEYSDVSLINFEGENNKTFVDVINETNAYLCKNVGTSADFALLQDICERKVEALETEISSSINVPLYLGLGGTFIGIITGLIGLVINVSGLFSANSMTPLRSLLFGVVFAMFASLIGLALMVINSAFKYKSAIRICDKNKNSYYDFLRRELMPILSNSMASSLNSLKSVLGEFIGKFGQNLDAYSNSAELLNDNIEKQHLLLVEINKMKEKEIATQIAETFNNLKDASDSLEVFKKYQSQLNETTKNVDTAIAKIDSVVTSFDDFAGDLKIVVANQTKAGELQDEFKTAIERHFPTGDEGKEMWRKQFDNLMEDASTVSEELNKQLKASTEHIKNFVIENQTVFSSMEQLQNLINKLIEYTNVQATCYQDLKKEIVELKKEQIISQSNASKLNGDLLTAVHEMISAIKTIKN